jgi:hypothetical protein
LNESLLEPDNFAVAKPSTDNSAQHFKPVHGGSFKSIDDGISEGSLKTGYVSKKQQKQQARKKRGKRRE